MAQITEDYVSYETAKLLKERGFDGICGTAYETITNEHEVEQCSISEWGKLGQVKRPTLQMAMKWLREVHKLHVEPSMTIEKLGFTFLNKWHCFVAHVDNKNQVDLKCIGENFGSYEEACEFGIKYCLNLI